MDLTFTEAEEEFRHEARTWLEANVPARFTVLDDRDQTEMLERASLAVMLDASRDPDSAIGRDDHLVKGFALARVSGRPQAHSDRCKFVLRHIQ